MTAQPPTWRRILGRSLILGGSLVVVAILASPWWLGAAMRLWGRDHGVTFAAYSRLGLTRWALDDLEVQRNGVRVRVARVEAPQPWLWVWRKHAAGPILLGSWSVEVTRPALQPDREPPTLTGWTDFIARFGRLRPYVVTWLPPVTAGAGAVGWRDQAQPWFTLAAAEARDEVVRVQDFTWYERRAQIELAWPEPEAWRGQLTEADEGWSAEGTIAGSRIAVDGQLWAQPVQAQATFAATGWMPRAIDIRLEQWSLPAKRLHLESAFAQITADAALVWRDGRGSLDVVADGQPRADAAVPPLRVELHAAGDRERMEINALHVVAPGINAELEGPVNWSAGQTTPAGPSEFRVQADLAGWPGSAVKGKVAGRVTVNPRGADWPELVGQLAVTGFSYRESPALDLSIEGRLTHGHLELDHLQGRDAAGSEITLTAQGDVLARRIDQAEGNATVQGATLAPWWPAGWDLETVQLRGTAAGTWPEVVSTGTLASSGLRLPHLQPLALTAEWTSHGPAVQVNAGVKAGAGALAAVFTADPTALTVASLSLLHAGQAVGQLQEALQVSWQSPLHVATLRVTGPGIEIAVPWLSAQRGEVRAKVQKPDLAWWTDWGLTPMPIEELRSAEVVAQWDENGLVFTSAGVGTLDLAEVGNVDFAVDVASDAAGLQVREFRVGRGEQSFATMTGQLPVHLRGPSPWGATIDEDGALQLNLQVSPNPSFWRAVGTATGVTVQAPEAEVALTGQWHQPQGHGRLAVGRIKLDSRWGGREWPDLQHVRASLTGDGDGLRLDQLEAEFEGNAVRMNGRLPLTAEDWATLRDSPWRYLREKGEATIEVPGIDLATLAKIVPEYLVPTGRMSGQLHFAPGGRIEGAVNLTGAASRPLGPLGVLQEVEAQLTFHERTIQLTRIRALMGGQPVVLAGEAHWTPEAPTPTIALTLRGNNLPLVRRTGLLLRGDLDLSVTTEDDGRGRVFGQVSLHDGLMLTDVRSLVPTGGGERRAGRPPYFSVDVKPFANWLLDVDVVGHRFMRLRTPVLNGVASIDMQLEGTLGSPRALGEVSIDEGVVRLPFANFAVDDAYARLTAANPYEPQIHLSGEGKRLGYDLKMELSGTARDPRLEFTSDPSLPAADVLLLVMAGEAPKEELSYSQGQRALQLGVFFSRELVGEVLGFEGGDRLNVTSGEKLSRRGRETYQFTYDLDDRWTAIGEYDEFDYYNIGVKWRWLPRPDAGAESATPPTEAAHARP